MNERLLNVIKVFLIILGMLFLIQILLIIGAILGLVNFANFTNFVGFNTKSKIDKNEIRVINYIDEYKINNGTYPINLNGVKLNQDLDYKYSLSKNKNCYTLKITSNKNKQNKSTKTYQKCSIQNNDLESFSEVYTFENN